MQGIRGKNVLITGSSSGIGQAIAIRFAQEGANVAINFRSSAQEAEMTHEAIHAAMDQMDQYGGKHILVQADVSKEADCRALVAGTVAQLGRLDVLVNMASVYRSRPFGSMTAADWDEDLNVNLKAAFICAQAAAPHLARQGGRIVNFSDWLAVSGRPAYRDFVAYYVAKAGVKALTEALALQLAKFPQLAMLGDRRSAYEQWDLPLGDALANELERGMPALAEAASGAARFQRGAGRHGSFEDT